MILSEKNKIPIDIASKKNNYIANSTKNVGFFEERKSKNKSILVSRGKITDFFYTEDSKLYITPKEKYLLEKGVKLDRRIGKWDNLSSRIVSEFEFHVPTASKNFLSEKLKIKQQRLQDDIVNISDTVLGHFSMVRLWNLSIVGAILVGMFSMTMIYRYLGQGAAANDIRNNLSESNESKIERIIEDEGYKGDEYDYTKQLIENTKIGKKEELEKEIMNMVKGYPIEEMIPYIAEKDRIVAAFIVGIAKKESNWGKRVPVLEDQDCYNYWGYRGIRKLMGTGGHTCFNSRKDAVDTIAKRIETLVEEYELDTPEKMVVWKCGSDCSVTGGQAAANKWIRDVNMYFKELK